MVVQKPFYHEAYLNILPLQVHYNKYSMDTILDFNDVANVSGSQITRNTAKERALIVTFSNINGFKFKECMSGLCYYDNMKHDDNEAINCPHKTKKIVIPYYMLQTVNNNKEYLIRQKKSGADKP